MWNADMRSPSGTATTLVGDPSTPKMSNLRYDRLGRSAGGLCSQDGDPSIYTHSSKNVSVMAFPNRRELCSTSRASQGSSAAQQPSVLVGWSLRCRVHYFLPFALRASIQRSIASSRHATVRGPIETRFGKSPCCSSFRCCDSRKPVRAKTSLCRRSRADEDGGSGGSGAGNGSSSWFEKGSLPATSSEKNDSLCEIKSLRC